MKAARVLSIIGLIIGLVWVVIILIGISFTLKQFEDIPSASRVTGSVSLFGKEVQTVEEIISRYKNIQVLIIIGIPIMIIAGVLGFLGPNKKPINIKPKILCVLLLLCGIFLVPFFLNILPAITYIIAAVLYFSYYKKNGWEAI